ncbi:MAG: DNA internalization-related competence protein ComEC/Rec2 [Pseudomonadota bacterium]
MLLTLCVGFIAGVVSQPVWPVLPVWPGGDGWQAVVLAALLSWHARRGRYRAPALFAAGVFLGVLCSDMAARDVLAARLPEARPAQDDVIEGRVRSVRQQADGSMSWVVVVAQVPWHDRPGKWTLRLGSRIPQPLAVGERWRLVVRLKPPHAAQNPGGADFERYLLGERTLATGYLREEGGHRLLAPATGFARWRQHLLDAALPLTGAGAGDLAVDDAARFARAVLPALVLDERRWLTPAQWRLLGDTGTAHLVAISGLHVALLWGGVLWGLTHALRRRAGTLRFRVLPVGGALAVAAGYAALAGMPLPAARATLMLAVVSALMLRDGHAAPWRVLVLATVVVLAADPLAVHAAGFWLSYGAVAILLLVADLHRRRVTTARHTGMRDIIVPGIRAQVLLSLLLAPLLFALFGTASVSSVVANLPAIPLVNLLALPAALGGFLLASVSPALADPLLELAQVALVWWWQWLVVLDRLPMLAPVALPGFTAAGVVLFAVALLALVVARGVWLRAAVLALLGLCWPVAPPVPAGQADVCVLDVGQGLSVIVRTTRHALLYDTGPAWSGESDAGRSIVVPALRALGISRLDWLVLSHHDSDHTGGAGSVAAAMAPRHILVGDLRSRIDGTGRRCERAERWQADAVDFLLLPGSAAGNDNERSCVLRVAAGKYALLVPGDISGRRELELAAAFPAPDALAADVLVAAHHGSRSSGTRTFLQRVAPRTVLFSAGYRNRFGHPHPEVEQRAGALGADTRRTAADGALCFRLRPENPPQVQALRAADRRYWRSRVVPDHGCPGRQRGCLW